MRTRYWRRILLSALCFLGLYIWGASAAEFHVAPTGDDAHPGSQEKPFLSLEAARDAARKHSPNEANVLWLHEGRHLRTTSFTLDKEDSGSADAPLTIRAMPGAQVILDGGRVLPPSAFEAISEWKVRKRIAREVRKEVLQADLKALGITEYGSYGPRGFARPMMAAPPELFINGAAMRIAQWPNPGERWIRLGRVIDKGSVPRYGDDSNRPGVFRYRTERAEKWTEAKDLYITGFFAWGYAEDTVQIATIDTQAGTFTTVQPHLYGYGGGTQKSLWKWYAVNLLEEIDQPGEYFIDRETGMLYLYPPHDLSKAHIQISLLEGPFIQADGVNHIRVEGITLENGRANGIEMTHATGILIAGCTVRNLGGRAISLRGEENVVSSCDIYGAGSGGVSINGGDRKTLRPAKNVVRNCDIHHLNRWYRNYHPCIGLGGVGNVAEHNHLHHCPGQGMIVYGNDHRVEYNSFHHLIAEMSDQGAVYTGRNPSQAGSVYRYNFFHHTATTHVGSYGNSGIFFDDGDSGQYVYGNVFYKTGSNGAVKYHGGQFNAFINNLVVDCKVMIKYQLWDQERWSTFLQEESMQKKLLNEVNILEAPYSTRYPKLAKIFETPYDEGLQTEERNYITTAADPVFKDGSTLDFRVQDWTAIQAKTPGFEAIPFEKIGLYKDKHRSAAGMSAWPPNFGKR